MTAKHRVRQIVILITLGMLTSCSIFTSDTSTSFKLLKNKHIDSIDGQLNWVQMQSNPVVYKSELGSSEDSTSVAEELVYLAPIRECGLDSGQELGPSLTRQLFVGLTHLRIQIQKQYHLAETQVAHWLAEAFLDDEPLSIASYSFIQNACVVDFVLWSKKAPPSENFVKYTKIFGSYVADYLGEEAPVLQE